MTKDLPGDVLRWVREGEQLFGRTLQALHRVEALAEENGRMRQEIETLRAEVESLKAERTEVAETLKTFAEHVTRVATIGIERLGRRAV